MAAEPAAQVCCMLGNLQRGSAKLLLDFGGGPGYGDPNGVAGTQIEYKRCEFTRGLRGRRNRYGGP